MRPPGFSAFLNSDITSRDKVSYLNTILQSPVCFTMDADTEKVIEDTIKECIGLPATRFDALRTWLVFIEKYEFYLRNWGLVLRAGLELKGCSVKLISLDIFELMIVKFGRKYNTSMQQVLPELLPALFRDLEDNEEFIRSGKTLAVCMKYLPESLGNYSVEIEEFLEKNFHHDSTAVVEVLADCFSALPKCAVFYIRPKTPYANKWMVMYQQSINTLDNLLDDIMVFHIGANGPRQNSKAPAFKIPCELEGGAAFLSHKIRVLFSLSRCLGKLICSDSKGVRVSIEELLVLIKRMLSVPVEASEKLNAEDCEIISLYLPTICKSALMLLEALVLKFNIAEQANNIVELVLKPLDYPQPSPDAGLFYSWIRCAVWHFLNVWIKQSGCLASSKIISKRIVAELLNEIAFCKIEKANCELVTKSCLESLRVLNGLMQSGCNFFDRETLTNIVTTVLQIVRKLQLYLHPSRTFPLPYSNDACREELYNLLLACCLNNHSYQNKCFLQSVNIFRRAFKDPSTEVTNISYRAFSFLQFFLHLKKPPPDYKVHSAVRALAEPHKDELVDYEQQFSLQDDWPQNRLNGHADPGEEMLPLPPLYPVSGEYSEAAMDDDSRERPTEQDSPPHYVELEPSMQRNHYNRTMSRQSSHSDGGDESESEEEEEEEAMEEDKESSIEEEEEEEEEYHPQIPCEASYIPVTQNSARPNIQILEAHSAADGPQGNEAKSDDDSSDANAADFRTMQLDQNSIEVEVTPMPSPKRVVSENGGRKDSDEEEFDVFDDKFEEEHVVKEYSGVERTYSPEPEEITVKKQKIYDENMSLEEEHNKQKINSENMSPVDEHNRHSVDSEEMASNEESNDERPVDSAVNGKEDESASLSQKESPTVEDMTSDFILAEPVQS